MTNEMTETEMLTLAGGKPITATCAPAGGFWTARIGGERAAFFGKTATEAFAKARAWRAGK